LEATKKQSEKYEQRSSPQKDTITYFDDFRKLDMTGSTIIEAEKGQGQKMLVLKVDTGLDVRTIVSGIAKLFREKRYPR